MIKVSKTKLKDVLMFQLDLFKDHRGSYTQLYRKDEYSKTIKEELGKEVEFLEDDFAVS